MNGYLELKKINEDLIESVLCIEPRSDITLLENGFDYGNVVMNKKLKILSFHEKTTAVQSKLTNSGVYCMKLSLLKNMKKNKFYSLDKNLFPEWIKIKNIFGYVVDEPFYDIGTIDRYKSTTFE